MKETWIRSLGPEDPLEKEMATHISILTWKIPGTEEPGGLQPMGLQRVRHDSARMHSREVLEARSMLLEVSPLGMKHSESGGKGSLVQSHSTTVTVLCHSALLYLQPMSFRLHSTTCMRLWVLLSVILGPEMNKLHLNYTATVPSVAIIWTVLPLPNSASRRRQWHPTPVLLPGKSMDRGAWWAAVHGVAQSQTWLSDFTFTFHFHALEKEMATHSSVLAWRTPGTGEPDGLPSVGLYRVGHDWSDLAAALAFFTYNVL